LRGECLSEDYNLDKILKETNLALEKIFNNIIALEMKLEYIEFVFTPNKPSMYSPSTKGTRLKKDYRVFVIIDYSISCFNNYMRPYSIKIVLAVMKCYL
jgi:hypothetical protein